MSRTESFQLSDSRTVIGREDMDTAMPAGDWELERDAGESADDESRLE